MRKFKFKKILLALFLCLIAVSASGCASNVEVLLTNAAQDIGAVADRNMEVIRDLEKKGVISTATATTYKIAIETKKQEYTAALQTNSDDKVKALSGGKSAQKLLGPALVYSLGTTGQGYNMGVTSGKLSDCEHSANHLGDSFTDCELDSGWDNYSQALKANGDENVNADNAISFLSEGEMGQLVNELNRDIWVLDPARIKTKADMVACLNLVQAVKNNTDAGQVTKQQQMNLVHQYFNKVEGLKVYNLEATIGNENSILALSTDNSSWIGSVASANMNAINKDVVVSAPIAMTRHRTVEKSNSNGTTTTEHTETQISKEIGVYSFRVVEFKENFINSLSQEVFTTNQYVAVNPEASTSSAAAGASNEVGIALLMEYPVIAIDGLSANTSSSDWEFNFLDYDSTNMRINIYNGEMLVKDSSGKWVEANKIDDVSERIYRVLPDNIGYIAETQNTISFLPATDSVTMSSGEIINQSNNYDKVKILKPKVDESSNAATLLDDFEMEIRKVYPEQFLRRVGYGITGDAGTYTIHNEDTGTTMVLTAKEYKVTDSVFQKDIAIANFDTWDKIWTLYENYAAKIKATTGRDYGDVSNFTLYKIYKALEENNKWYTDSSGTIHTDVTSNLTSGFIYNAFMQYFSSEGQNDLVEVVGSDFDKAWVEYLEDPYTSFYYHGQAADGEAQLTFEYSYKREMSNWDNAHISAVKTNMREAGCGQDFNLINTYYAHRSVLGYVYPPISLYRFDKVQETILSDANCGKEVDITDSNRDKLIYDVASRRWEFEYDGKTYLVTPITTANTVTNAQDIRTVQFMLTDYLELTYMPGVIEDEPFIATGRRICFEKFKGTGDEVIGYYANKYGDPILDGTGERINVKVSDIVDKTSGADGYYESIAKGLEFDAFKNDARINTELAKSDSNRLPRLKDLYISQSSGEEDTGMIQDKSMFVATVYEPGINPILQFTSNSSGDTPALDATDVGNGSIKPSMYYGVCVNTNAFTTGLYTGWIEVTGKGEDIGSLEWWNTWLEKQGYNYRIDIGKLKQVLNGVYAVSLADLDNTIIFNANTLKVINEEITEEDKQESKNIIRTVEVIIGILLLVYGFFMMACWLIDTNLVNGPGFLTIITFGKFVSIRDTSEMPRMVDGRIYTDFKYLCILTVLFTALGIVLILFDIQSIWIVVNKLLSSAVDLFKNLLLNR